jgi:serine/threonine protein kinase/Flp pilus assembly protein TadD
MEEAARLAEVLAANWRRGICCRAEELLVEHPSVQAQPRAALRVVLEEVCQREHLGQEVSLAEWQERFPQWRDELAVVLDCHRLLGLAPGSPRFPQVGETLGEFRILAEVGRGGGGRVYLAEQTFLAGRLVVLKLTPAGDQEHLKLARLQHTHIVPLYSVRDFPDRHLRQLCMPCLGGASLQQILARLSSVPPEQRSGRRLLEALRASVAHPSMFWPAQGPNPRFLEQATYVQAVCWMGVCLADALHYAHGQGLVHLDVKPSNVLLTADCQPMLLDFHLAREPIQPNSDTPDWLGGTPGYMSPEQQAAWRNCRDQQPITAAVDARSDIFSLGLLLREALYGEATERQALRPDLALPARADLSPGLRDVLARCLHPDPAARYANVAELAEDLRRHLTNRPLLGVGNRSFAERWRKWRRRRPHALLLFLCLAVCLAALLAFGLHWFSETSQRRRQEEERRQQRRHEGEEALQQGRRLIEQQRYAEAVGTFDRALERLGEGADGGQVSAELRRQRQRAVRAYDVETLHERMERSRYLLGDELLAPTTLRTLAAECRSAWEERRRLLDAEGEPLAADTEEALRRDLLDVAILWAECRVRLATENEAADARNEALHILNEAVTLLGPSPVLSRLRRTLDPAAPDDGPAPRTAWEHYILGSWLLRSGDLGGAAAASARAVELRPQDFRPWFGKGVCAHRRGRTGEAVTAFSVCVALAPEQAVCYYNRGLALAAHGDADAALRDYNQALRLDPRLAAAALNRGALHLQEGRFAEAAADLQRALELGANPDAVRHNQELLNQARQRTLPPPNRAPK